MPPSHLFVFRGNLTHFMCDAWLLPGDTTYTVEDPWYDAVPGLRQAIETARGSTPRFGSGEHLATAMVDWPGGDPLPVLTAVPLDGVLDPADVRPAVRAFVTTAAAAVAARDRMTDRSVPLLGMPAFATGAGGGGPQRGAVLLEVITAARDAATEVGVDVALVLWSESDLALTQAQRKRADAPEPWPDLSPRLRGKAEELAAVAAQGRLVPFMGAGVSVSAGLPTWAKLIDQLAVTAELTGTQRHQLGELDVLDQGHVLRELFQEQGLDFGATVVAAVDRDRYGLAPALLATLPVTQAVTLNYDRLFEIASADAGHRVAVLPEASAAAGDRWLLKLHGSVTDPSSIVLTRDDYLGYGANREALSAIVKALLITHHLLFVGFGLTDDHFHAIVHDVRRAMPDRRRTGASFGTALVLDSDDLQRRVWADSLDLLPMTDSSAADADHDSAQEPMPEAARLLEIFLDCLLAHASDSQTYLLAPEYDGVLSGAERSLRSKLRDFAASCDAAERATPAWRVIANSLRQLGGPDHDVPAI